MSTVLLVDDDDSLPLLLEHAIRRCGVSIELHSVRDGEDAVHYLTRDHRAELPSLVLLDLKMPRMNGFEVLKWKQTQPRLDGLRVVVWSSSNLEADTSPRRLVIFCEADGNDRFRGPTQGFGRLP